MGIVDCIAPLVTVHNLESDFSFDADEEEEHDDTDEEEGHARELGDGRRGREERNEDKKTEPRNLKCKTNVQGERARRLSKSS